MILKELLETRYNLSEDVINLLFMQMEQILFSKKEEIQGEGKMDYYIYFVESGIIRSYMQRDGKTVTLCIVDEGGSPLSFSKLTQPGISKITIDALTDCVLWRIPRNILGKLCKESIVLSNFTRELAEDFISVSEIFLTEYYYRDKKEQYKLLMKQQPGLRQRISLNEIASYLSITPQSLSRIRAHID